jgi:uncharacterized protein (DUF1501 family)
VVDNDYLRAQRELWEPATGPNGMSRRRFLQALGLGTGVAIATPSVLQRLEAFGDDSSSTDGILVLVMLGGGNDGLNTVVPFTDSRYQSLRPELKFNAPNSASRATLSINDPNVGLHPNLPKLRARYLQNQVGLVRGVGYTPPDLSHFSSMGYWMQGWKDAPPRNYANGWVGRYMDTLPAASTNPLLGVCLGASVPLHMIGSTVRASGLPVSISGAFGIDRSKANDARMFDTFSGYASTSSGKGQWADLYTATGKATMALAQTVQPAYATALPNDNEDDIVTQLTLTARLINLNLGTRVFQTHIGSFDTHADQDAVHDELLTELDNGIESLFANLSPAMRSRVTLLTFSEFGRRPQENNGGTDHGTAGVNFVVGDKVKGGLYGAQPSLTDLDANGNLKYNVDFRAVYAELLASWLGADPTDVLGQDYPRLGLFTGAPTSSSTPSPTASSTTATTATLAPPAPTEGSSTTTTSTTTETLPTTTPGTLPRTHRHRRSRSSTG